MSEPVKVTRTINAPAEHVWSMISDITRMGEWSPENEGGEWLGGATGPAVGAKFRATNRHGKRTWKTVATVVTADPGHEFAFRVMFMGRIPVADWEYSFTTTDGGCEVTESWNDLRPGFFKPIAQLGTGVGDRENHNRAGMEQTLEALAKAAESAAS